MVTKLLATGILLVGVTLTANGMIVRADDILANTKSVVGRANIHQFQTALDLYYLDHDSYPDVSGSDAMIKLLIKENYIKENAPVNTSEFSYQVKDSGQDYSLNLSLK